MSDRAPVQPLSIAPVQRRLDARLAAAPIVQLNIGRLSLRGVTPAEGRRIAGAFERELRIQLASQPLPLHSARPNALRLPPLQRAAGERPESTGRRLARLVALQWQGGHDRGPGGHGP